MSEQSKNETTETKTTTTEETTTSTAAQETTDTAQTSQESKTTSEETILDTLKKESSEETKTTTEETKNTPVVEDYELELSKDSPLKEEDLEGIVRLAEKYKLPKDEAEALIKEKEAVYAKATENIKAKAMEVLNAEKEKFKKDPDFSGANLVKSMKAVDLAIEKYGDDSLKEYLKGPGGNSLPFVKFLKKIGELGMPDTFHGKTKAPESKGNAEEEFYKRQYPGMFEEK